MRISIWPSMFSPGHLSGEARSEWYTGKPQDQKTSFGFASAIVPGKFISLFFSWVLVENFRKIAFSIIFLDGSSQDALSKQLIVYDTAFAGNGLLALRMSCAALLSWK